MAVSSRPGVALDCHYSRKGQSSNKHKASVRRTPRSANLIAPCPKGVGAVCYRARRHSSIAAYVASRVILSGRTV